MFDISQFGQIKKLNCHTNFIQFEDGHKLFYQPSTVDWESLYHIAKNWKEWNDKSQYKNS